MGDEGDPPIWVRELVTGMNTTFGATLAQAVVHLRFE